MNEELYEGALLDIPEEIYMEEFSPMEERLIGTEMKEAFQSLKEKTGSEGFERYFNVLINIKKHEKDLLIVTESENHRAMILRQYEGMIKEVFEVKNIRIVVQSR